MSRRPTTQGQGVSGEGGGTASLSALSTAVQAAELMTAANGVVSKAARIEVALVRSSSARDGA